MEQVFTLFHDYMGTGLIMIWFLLSVLYLLITEKRKDIRILFAYVPILLLLIFFHPFFAKLVYGMADDEIYYRILWLLPITPAIAYSAVRIYGSIKKTTYRYLYAVIAAVLIMVSGSYIYANPYFHVAENRYHMPQSVVDICDAIEIPGREVSAVFPVELLQYVRQYSALICMPYGREVTVDRWYMENELYTAMEATTIDAEYLTSLTKDPEYRSVYIILPQDKLVRGNFSDYGYELYAAMDGYDIYRDVSEVL